MKKICIMGTARSGTTFLYAVLYDLLAQVREKPPRAVYEPLLWGEATWDRPYREIGDAFNSMESLSWEGICSHLKMPLFIDGVAAEHGASEPGWGYLPDLLNRAGRGEDLLMKVIRAHGRYRVLRMAAPDAKLVFTIRNPMDVLNSMKQIGSLLGTDWHASDFGRLCDAVGGAYPDEASRLNDLSPMGREAAWWYYTNRFALESIRDTGDPHFLLAYETLKASPARVFAALLDVLGLDYDEALDRKLREQVGPGTPSVRLSRRDVAEIEPWLRRYPDLLSEFSIENAFDPDQVLARYDAQAEDEAPGLFLPGATPNYLRTFLDQAIVDGRQARTPESEPPPSLPGGPRRLLARLLPRKVKQVIRKLLFASG